MFEKKIEDKNVEVEGLDCEKLMVEADADLMQQVIYNLIENAVKFVNTGGVISFSFGKTGKECFASVRNTGEGLTDDELPKVFERFYKTHRNQHLFEKVQIL